MGDAPLIPVNLLTGFLGSGKTTVLRRLLADPAFSGAAVLINEFGEVGLDHLLVERLDQTTLLLESGCICCSLRDDLRTTLSDLISRRQRGTLPPFDRIIMETTGLADPTPVMATIMTDPVLRHHVRMGNAVATVDAVNGAANLESFPLIRKQVAVADRILLTKADLVDAARREEVSARLAVINPNAPIIPTVQGDVSPADLIGRDVHDTATKTEEVHAWIVQAADGGRRLGMRANPLAQARLARLHGAGDKGDPAGAIETRVVTIEAPIEWTAFGLWLSLLLGCHGARILRLKGIVNVEGSDTPVVVHGVQSLLHPAEHLPGWPTAERRTLLVMIAQDLDLAQVERSLLSFLKLGTRVRAGAPAPARDRKAERVHQD